MYKKSIKIKQEKECVFFIDLSSIKVFLFDNRFLMDRYGAMLASTLIWRKEGASLRRETYGSFILTFFDSKWSNTSQQIQSNPQQVQTEDGKMIHGVVCWSDFCMALTQI